MSNENAGVVVDGVAPVAPVAVAKVKKERVSLEQFVTAWESSNSVAEVHEKTGLKETSVQARASKYRSEGIPLKEMQRGGGAKLDVANAQALLAKLRGVDVDVVETAAAEASVKRETRRAEREAEKAGVTVPENAPAA